MIKDTENSNWITITSSKKNSDLHIKLDNTAGHFYFNISKKGSPLNDISALYANSISDIIDWWFKSENVEFEDEFAIAPESNNLVEVI